MTKPPDNQRLIFGPVPSRRLGLSLGVDLVPHKVCTLDCIYCQVGHTTEKTLTRAKFVDIEALVAELSERLTTCVTPDYITLSGSGEPTLNAELGPLIDRIKTVTDIPVALITNGTLFTRPEVRQDCAKADVVLPSLDAADATHFERINRPHPDLSAESHVAGLVAFRQVYQGPLWLEVFLAEGLNTDVTHLENLRHSIARIAPDRIHLNTAVRPTADAVVPTVDQAHLNAIAKKLGPQCEVVADFSRAAIATQTIISTDDILLLLRRRPCSLDDMVASLGQPETVLSGLIEQLCTQKHIVSEAHSSRTFYKIADPF